MSTQSAVKSLGPQPTNIALVRLLDSQSLLSQWESLHESDVWVNLNDDVIGAKVTDPTGKVCLFDYGAVSYTHLTLPTKA